jgi:hypothetical protein
MVYDALRPRTIQQLHVSMVENAERQDFVANPQSLWWHFNALSLAQAPTSTLHLPHTVKKIGCQLLCSLPIKVKMFI